MISCYEHTKITMSLLETTVDFSYYFFFFSSRRRHTRYIGDWSSDVCSSDLVVGNPAVWPKPAKHQRDLARRIEDACSTTANGDPDLDRRRQVQGCLVQHRSEERRVGKEFIPLGWAMVKKKKKI